MGKCIVFGGSKISDYSYIKIKKQDSDMVICADYGYIHAQNLGVKADLLIGDFDSAPMPNEQNVIKLPAHKDETDMFLAIEKGVECGYKTFDIYAGLGGRFDHTYANIQLLSYFIDKKVRINLIDENNRIFMIMDEVIDVTKTNLKYLSIFSYTESCVGLSLHGLKYTVHNATIDQNFPLGVSNEIIANKATIELKSGKALIVLSSDK